MISNSIRYHKLIIAQSAQMCTHFKVIITFLVIWYSEIIVNIIFSYIETSEKKQQSINIKRKYYKMMMNLTNIQWRTVDCTPTLGVG